MKWIPPTMTFGTKAELIGDVETGAIVSVTPSVADAISVVILSVGASSLLVWVALHECWWIQLAQYLQFQSVLVPPTKLSLPIRQS